MEQKYDQVLRRWEISRLSADQERVVTRLLNAQRVHLAVILPTGAGKSLCFQLPAALFEHPTLVIYPLRSLLADQKRRSDGLGLRSVVLQGGQTREQRKNAWEQIQLGVDLILTNPETLSQPRVLEQLTSTPLSHVVIDEAHCTELWGKTFRPVYRLLAPLIEKLKAPRVTAFTATATDRVVDDWAASLFGNAMFEVVRASADRPNLDFSREPYLSIRRSLPRTLLREARPALVFCRSRDKVRRWAHWLHLKTALDVKFYHAGLSRPEKTAVENWFSSSCDGVLVATNAYGMGVDKPNIRTVIHLEAPPSPEDYLQEAGRAGRDGNPARAIQFVPDSFPRRSTPCVRKDLLTPFGEPQISCGRCSSCRGENRSPPQDVGLAIRHLAPGVRRWTRSEARRWLSGRARPSQWDDPGFPTVHEALWGGLDDLTFQELWSGLERSGAISFARRGLWSGLLKPLDQIRPD